MGIYSLRSRSCDFQREKERLFNTDLQQRSALTRRNLLVNLKEFQAKISTSNLFSTFTSPAVSLLGGDGDTPEVCDMSVSPS
jgi:hypothetical protein